MEKLDRAMKNLLIKDPFYGYFLLGINKYLREGIETMGVGIEGVGVCLVIDPKFLEESDTDEVETTLKHECLHIALKHIYEDFPEHTIDNYACDLSVNSYIEDLQKDPYVYPQLFGFPVGESRVFYYKKLLESIATISIDIKFVSKSSSNDGSSSNGSSNEGSSNSIIVGKKLADDHSGWKDFRGASEAEKELISDSIDAITREAAEQTERSQGKIPGCLKEYINNLFKQKKQIYNWRALFRQSIGTTIDIYLKKTRKRENIRFPDSPGFNHRKKHDILLCIDTSGSVSDKDLCDFFSEINYIYKAGAKITIIEFDTQINKTYEYKGQVPENITGRGGTEYKCAYNYYKEHLKDYSMCVFFGDGYDSEITELQNIGKILWVLTNDCPDIKYPGKVIKISKQD